MKPVDIKLQPYQTPRLEQHGSYALLTGLSLPFNGLLNDPMMEQGGEEQ
jgi:hypothetical protein